MSAVDDLAARIVALERSLGVTGTSAQLAHTSIENGAVPAYDAAGRLRSQVGRQFDGTYTSADFNGPPPPTLAGVTVEEIVGGLVVHWDGTFTDALFAPVNWQRAEVHVSEEQGFPAVFAVTMRNTIESPRGGQVTVPLPYRVHYAKLVARNSAGVVGAASVEVSGTPRRAEQADIGPDLAAIAGTKVWYGTDPTLAAGNDVKAGDLWYTQAPDPDPVTGEATFEVRRRVDAAWSLLLSGDAAKALGAAITAQQAADLADRTTVSATAPPAPAVDDYWRNPAEGNQLRRWDGTAWVPVLLGNGAIAPKSLIARDVVATGTVSAALLEAVLVLASRVVAGDPAGQRVQLDPDGLDIVDSEGSLVGEFSNVGQGFSRLVVGEVVSPSITTRLDVGVSLTLHVSSATGDDNAAGGATSPIATIAEAIRRIPLIVNGLVDIKVAPTHTEPARVEIRGITGGGDILVSKWVTGETGRPRTQQILIAGCTVYCYIRDLVMRDPIRCVDVDRSSNVRLLGLSMYGPGTTVAFTRGVRAFGSRVAVEGCDFHDMADAAIFERGSIVECRDNTGACGDHGYYVFGSILMLTGTQPSAPNLIDARDGSIVGGTATSSAPATVAPPPASPVTSKFTATSSASWRPLGWRSGSDVYQGDGSPWGGTSTNKGLWFFDDAAIRAALAGRSVTRVQIGVKRLGKGGVSGAKVPSFRYHNHASRPTGEPVLESGQTHKSYAWGEYDVSTLPAFWGSRFRDNLAKGVAVWDPGGPYMIFSGAATLWITHE